MSAPPPGPPRRGELLLELLSEEIPARMQRRAIADLSGFLRDKLAAAGLPSETIRGYVTPRRLAIIAEGIPPAQPDRSEERRGPRLGASPRAIDGFVRSAGLDSIDECEIRDSEGRGAFYFAVVGRPGRPAAEVLPELIRAAIGELSWPKSMRWPGSSLRWVRPLTSLLCLFDGEIVPLAADWLGGGVPIGRMTRGHRFLAPAGICVAGAADYLEKLQHAHVIIDQDQRRQAISSGLARRAADLGVTVKQDPALLEEVTGLAEFPVVLAGTIDADFMGLPPEVLATAMRAHQKYFSCVDADGAAAPHFLFVADNLAEDGGKAIVAGNERVLRARLADARFFWEQDRKTRLEDRVAALKDRVYHDRLGSVYDKVLRVEQLAVFLAGQLHPSVTPAQAGVQGSPAAPLPLDSRLRRNDEWDLGELAKRAAHLAKADLSTGMVAEFPELQGIMGGYYARHDGEDPRVSGAITEHYKPLGTNDACPTAPESVVVALADKIDALVGFFGIGEKPSGSRDPFALRRAGLGIIRLIIENRLRLPLVNALHRSFEIWREALATDPFEPRFSGVGPFGIVEPTEELLEFIVERVKVHLRGRGVRQDLIAAAFANPLAAGARSPSEVTAMIIGASVRPDAAEDDLVRLLARVDALRDFSGSEEGAGLLIAYRRAANIVAIEEKRDGRPHSGPIEPALLRQAEERHLADRLAEVSARAEPLLQGEEFGPAMTELARLRQPVDGFFDKVTVNTAEPELRGNRLRLLSQIRATMNRVADFSQIEG